MKKYIFCLSIFIIAFASFATAQIKIGYFVSELIIKQLPDAVDAQKQLDQLTSEWQQELAKMQEEWKSKYEEYDKKKLIMTEQRRAEAEKELRELDKKIVDFRNQKFGQNGELFNKQNELMKPVQDRIFKAVQDVAIESGYDYVFDKSGDILFMYTNEKHDLTKKIFEKLKEPVKNITPTQQ